MVQRRAQVVVFVLEPVEHPRIRGRRGGRVERRRCSRRGERQERRSVPVAQRVGLAPLSELLQRVLANRLEHRESDVAVEVFADPQQALFRESLQSAEHVERQVVVGDPADGVGRVDRTAAGEHAEPREQRLVIRIEEVMAPVDGAAQRSLALRHVASARRQ